MVSQEVKSASTLLLSTVRLFYAIAVFWAVFGVWWLFRDSDYRVFYFATGLANGAVIAILGYYLGKKQRWAFWGAVVVLGINILLTITDQIGWFDFLYLVPAVVLFGLVLRSKRLIN